MEEYNSMYSAEDADAYIQLPSQDPWWEYCDKFTTRKILGDISGMRILEVGCGEGRMCRNLIEWGAAKVVGVDISEPMVNLAKTKAKPEVEEYHVRDCFTLQRIGEFDMATSFYVMQSSSSYEQLVGLVRAGYNNLKAGGTMAGIVSCYCDKFPLHGRNNTMNLSFKRESCEEFTPFYADMGGSVEKPAILLQAYNIYPATLKKAFEEVGFKDLIRHPMELSVEGERYLNMDDVQRDCAHLFIFTARKPAGLSPLSSLPAPTRVE